MRKHRIATFFCVLFFSFVSFSQESFQERLKQFSNVSIEGKIELFFQILENIDKVESDTLLTYAEKLYLIGRENYRGDAVAMGDLGMGRYFLRFNLFPQAREKYQSALRYYIQVENNSLCAETYNFIANTFFLEGDFSKAMDFYNKSYESGLKVQDKWHQMRTSYNIARVYIELEEYEEAEKRLNEVIEFYTEKKSELHLTNAYASLGHVYLNQEKFDKAKEYFLISADYGFSLESINYIADAYTNLAITAFYSEDYDLSEQYFRYSLDYWKKEKHFLKIAEAYFNMGNFYEGTENMDSAVANYIQSAFVAKESGFNQTEKESLEYLARIYEDLGQKENQIEILTRMVDLQEGILNRELKEDISALELSFQQTLEEFKNLEKIREEQLENRITSLESVFNYWIIIVLSGFVFLYILYIFIRKRNKSSEKYKFEDDENE